MRLPPALVLARLGVVALLPGCGADGPPANPPPPVQQRLDQAYGAARAAWDQGGYAQAASLYDRLLRQAEAADDLDMIARAGFEGALAHLRADDPATAADRARLAREELARRGGGVPASLFLVEATAAYRLDDAETADALAAEAIARADADDAAAARAWFLRGLIAADRQDVDALSRALAALPVSDNPGRLADRLELEAHRNLLTGGLATAQDAALRAVPLRRRIDDLFGMARVLALAGRATARMGARPEAADLLFRAGRAAWRVGRTRAARDWLNAAAETADAADLPALAASARALGSNAE